MSIARDMRSMLGGSLSGARPAKKVVGTLYPNGEFSYAFVPSTDDVAWESEPDEYPMASLDPHPLTANPLDSSRHNNSHRGFHRQSNPRPRNRYGIKGMSGVARRKVRSSAYLMQQRFGRERLSFLTLTVPTLSDLGVEKLLAENWGKAVQRMVDRLKKLLKEHGLPLCIVGVTELQTKRYEKTGKFCLHLHVLFVGRQSKKTPWALKPIDIRNIWGSIIEDITGQCIYRGALENLQQVKRSGEGYLGKYMSKNHNEIRKVVEDGNEWMLPKQWWFSTYEMKKWLKRNTFRSESIGNMLSEMIYEIENQQADLPVVYYRKIVIEFDSGPYVAGCIGRLDPSFLRGVT